MGIIANYYREKEQEEIDAYNAIEETFDCDGWQNSNCCNMPIKYTDICTGCGEHCETMCYDCNMRHECQNENKKDSL